MQPAQFSLQEKHTLALPVNARSVTIADSKEQIIDAWKKANQSDNPFLLLGQGSNVLFLEDFNGYVVINAIKGIEIQELDDDWLIHANSGENWHELIRYLLDKGIAGLENLALIPGCVGSAPIQNIGAYGIELKNVCAYVDLLDLTTGKIRRLTAEECEFGYRESIFKHQYRDGYAIIAVGLLLPKQWQPILTYGDLKSLDPNNVTPKAVFDCVCHMRKSKLPDPAELGNAGSFFKNPVVDEKLAQQILETNPNAPMYKQDDGTVKLAAGWLIDQCELKGYLIGGAAVHHKQALVIVNLGNATSQDIADLAGYVRCQVAKRFNVSLEPEVRFIAGYGEIDAVEFLS